MSLGQQIQFAPHSWLFISNETLMKLKEVKSTADVINQAIAENKAAERLFASLILLFILAGATILVWAIKLNLPILAFAGVFVMAYSYVPLDAIRKTRKESLAIRLLESPLNKADNASEAAAAISILLQPTAGDKLDLITSHEEDKNIPTNNKVPETE